MWLLNGRNYTNTILSDSLITRYVKQEDMLPLFNRFYGAAKDYTFVILGDCTIQDIKPLITTYIGGLPKGSMIRIGVIQNVIYLINPVH